MILKKIKLGSKAFLRINNWWLYFMDYLGLKNGEIIYKIKDKKIKARGGTIDKKIITELILDDKYFPKEISLPKNPLIIDLGGHIGVFSILSRLKFIDSKIYIIEPAKDNFNLILEQIKINDEKFISPSKIALSDKKGEMKLYGGNHSARGSLLRKDTSNFEIVNTLTLKEFFEKEGIEKCDLLKIDIEGGEYPVLYSTPRSVLRKIDKIFLELHDIEGENKEKLLNFLRDQGFNITFKEEDFVYCVRS